MIVQTEETISFAKENLGKEIKVEMGDVYRYGIIVGYNDDFVIVSFSDH